MSRKAKHHVAYLYLSPWLLGLALFQVYPIFSSLYFSFTDLRLLSRENFVGRNTRLEAWFYLRWLKHGVRCDLGVNGVDIAGPAAFATIRDGLARQV